MILMSCFEATVKPGRKRLNDCVELADRRLLKVPEIFKEGWSRSLLEPKLQVRQFLAA